jgi:hypothetical protein
MKTFVMFVTTLTLALTARGAEWVTYEPKPGTANGKHIVLLSGDEEYRTEEGFPQLGKILSQRHGFKCTVLFPINPTDGTIDPNNQTNIPGMMVLPSADLIICGFRFRELPDADMKYFVDYLNSGKPMIVVRTATHAFQYSRNPKSPYAKYDWRSKAEGWKSGFGGRTVGETWTYHHGDHGKEATRGLVDGRNQKHPIVRGVVDIFGPTDVYGVNPDFPTEATVLMWGQTLKGMKPDDAPNLKKAIMPIIWLRDYKGETGNTSKILCSTIGAAADLESEDLRRLFVNACYSLIGLEVPKQADVAYIGEFKPTFFGVNKAKKGVKPADYELK